MRFLRRAAGGAEAGLLAGAGVAVLFLIEDTLHLRFLATPAALASGLLGPGAPQIDGATLARVAAFGALGVRVLLYTVLHFLAFTAVGVTGAFFLRTSSFWASLGGGVLYGTTVCTGLFYGSRWITASPVAMDALGLPSVLLANAMAGAILGIGLHLAQADEGGATA